MGFPGGSDGEESAYNVQNLGSIPGESVLPVLLLRHLGSSPSILFLIEKILNWLDSNKYNCL